MRLLILGGAGMLGHTLWRVCRDRFDTWITIRGTLARYDACGVLPRDRTISWVDAANIDTLNRAIAAARPDVVVNCIGVVKQRADAADPVVSLSINALLPHQLARLVTARGARLLHISTDCVFSGRRGGYTEDDVADADDLYGRTKLLGEVAGPGLLTVRTSIIGRELEGTRGLLEWFLSRRGGRVPGFTRAFFSGLTTHALSEILARVIAEHHDLHGLYHVSGPRISKFELLTLLNRALDADIGIDPDASLEIDRSLVGEPFVRATGLTVPSWAAMAEQLAADSTPYDRWKTSC